MSGVRDSHDEFEALAAAFAASEIDPTNAEEWDVHSCEESDDLVQDPDYEEREWTDQEIWEYSNPEAEEGDYERHMSMTRKTDTHTPSDLLANYWIAKQKLLENEFTCMSASKLAGEFRSTQKKLCDAKVQVAEAREMISVAGCEIESHEAIGQFSFQQVVNIVSFQGEDVYDKKELLEVFLGAMVDEFRGIKDRDECARKMVLINEAKGPPILIMSISHL